MGTAMICNQLCFVEGAQQRLCLVHALLVFPGRVGVGDDATTSLNVGSTVLHDHSAQGNSCVQVARVTEVAHGSCVNASLLSLQLADDLHSTNFRRSRYRSCRKASSQGVIWGNIFS